MANLVQIFNTGDLRHLLIEYDEAVEHGLLIPFFDTIMQEFEQIKGSDDYSHHLEKVDDNLWKEYLIGACALTISCINLGSKDKAELMIEKFNLRIKLNEDKIIDRDAIRKLEAKIKQIRTTLKIKQAEEERDRQTSKKVSWEQLRAGIHTGLNVLPEYDCSVSQYLAYEIQLKELNAARKKQQQND